MKRFKNIAIAFVVCLSILLVVDLFCLLRLFGSVKDNTQKVIMNCIEQADDKEMQVRLSKIKKDDEKKISLSIDKSFNYKNNTTSIKTRTVEKVKSATTIDTVRSTNAKDFDAEYVSEISGILTDVRHLFHQYMDTVFPINIHLLDSLTVSEFQYRAIPAKVYGIQFVDLRNNTVISSSLPKSLLTDKVKPIEYFLDFNKTRAYHVFMTSLTKVVLMQMSGILITTFLIILLLAAAFAFFIRTVLKQKTMEEMKDDFTNNMTHELKTPIAVAYSAADTLLHFHQGDDKAKRDKYLQICLDQLTHLSGLVEQILSLSMERRKTMTLKKEIIVIKDLVDPLIKQFSLQTQKPIYFDVKFEPEDISVYADAFHLNNVISNLIDNAIKYSKEEAHIAVSAWRTESQVHLSVRDDGIGIAADQLDKVFDKFYRVPNGNIQNVKGYGLGLYYVKQIVDKHDAGINIQSVLDEYTQFTINFPDHER